MNRGDVRVEIKKKKEEKTVITRRIERETINTRVFRKPAMIHALQIKLYKQGIFIYIYYIYIYLSL